MTNSIIARAQVMGRFMNGLPTRRLDDPFEEGRTKVFALLREFKPSGIEVRGTVVPVCSIDFETLKKYIYLFQEEFSGQRMGFVEMSPENWVKLFKDRVCILVKPEDVADVEMDSDYVSDVHGKPLMDVTPSEAYMTGDDIERARREYPDVSP